MTTELRQAITLLQYSAMDLTEYLQEQSLENPLIELKEPLWEQGFYKSTHKHESDVNPLDFVSNEHRTLQDDLLTQIRLLHLVEGDYPIIRYMILLLDENGYFHEDLELVAEKFSVGYEYVEELLKCLQTLDPIGVGARSLGECLYLQLKNNDKIEEIALEIVLNDLELLADKKWKQIVKKYGVSLPYIQTIYDSLKTLNPRPGSSYNTSISNYIVPELAVQEDEGMFSVSFNDQSLPQISVNEKYQGYLKGTKQDDLTKYVADKYQQVMWLQKSIEQRRLTLLKVMITIIEKQPNFFKKGPKYLKPMTLKDVAEETELHESTVSRATTGKYVQTPHGVFELKVFFSSSIPMSQGGDTSSTEVKNELKQLIDDEDKKKPLSDQRLVELLKDKHGFVVSRRTVAKYRDQLKIPASSKRRRYDD
ncbi:RNA polymerase sigma-54 factor [Bacillus solimangrovi]|uniref:RNA polymerase sigma-54 factor n=2 Tax=Bacillus solimangrovi TaxID=1305675 RepID=A0A1E5LDZ9_9BACI|nr:RNA polymerase sigma-54 factor [Bacillus solimangrovi]